MPVVLTLAAVGVIALLMFVGWRRRWDPTPQELPPITLKSARQAAPTVPLPRWHWPLAVVSIVAVPLGAILAGVFGRPWIAIAGIAAYAATWVVRFTAISWNAARTRLQRVVAVARPVVLVLGVIIASAARSWWWGVGAAVFFVGTGAVTDALGRRRHGHLLTRDAALHGPGDNPR
jgi:hypothetical protein